MQYNYYMATCLIYTLHHVVLIHFWVLYVEEILVRFFVNAMCTSTFYGCNSLYIMSSRSSSLSLSSILLLLLIFGKKWIKSKNSTKPAERDNTLSTCYTVTVHVIVG